MRLDYLVITICILALLLALMLADHQYAYSF